MESVAVWIYFGLGSFTLLLLILSFILSEVADFVSDVASPVSDWMGDNLSFGHEGSFDVSHVVNSGSLLGFLAGFGFTAALMMAGYGVGAVSAALWGLLGGAILGALLGLIYLGLRKSAATSSYDLVGLVGSTGEVSERIFSGSKGMVVCAVKGVRAWNVAQAIDGSDIPVGTPVKIVKAVGNTLYVERED